MRNLRSPLTVLAAALYVLLGVSAAWHAPHFSRGEVAVGVDAHGDGHEIPSGDEACALCTWKSASQESVVPDCIAALSAAEATAQRPDPKVPADGLIRAARARAPPVFS